MSSIMMLYKPHIVTFKNIQLRLLQKDINQHMYHKYDGYAVIVHLYLCDLFVLTAHILHNFLQFTYI